MTTRTSSMGRPLNDEPTPGSYVALALRHLRRLSPANRLVISWTTLRDAVGARSISTVQYAVRRYWPELDKARVAHRAKDRP